MAFTPLHTAVGIGITRIIPWPWVSIPVAFLSHVFVDLYPEWYNQDKRYDWKEIVMGIVELGLMVVLGYVLFREKSWVVWAGAIAANLIDLWDGINVVLKRNRFWFCHPGGWFPVKVPSWQGFGMTALQTAVLDIIFVCLIIS